MARKDRHTPLVEWTASARNRRKLRKAKCDQFFSSTLWGEDQKPWGTTWLFGESQTATDSFVKGLILAQNERWRRGLGMQVERIWFSDQVSGVRVSKATATNPMVGHSRGKLRVIPSDVRTGHPV
jgi:hypothetical protein